MKSVYVAAGFTDWMRARALMELLHQRGYHVVRDWTQIAEAVQLHGFEENMGASAAMDVAGVKCCDVLVLLLGSVRRGAYMEFGAAAFSGKTCIVVGTEPNMDKCPFYTLSNVRVVAWEGAAIDALDDDARSHGLKL